MVSNRTDDDQFKRIQALIDKSYGFEKKVSPSPRYVPKSKLPNLAEKIKNDCVVRKSMPIKQTNMKPHTHSPRTCRKHNCKYMELDFVKNLNKPEIIKDSYKVIKQLDSFVNKLLIEHSFRDQMGDPDMRQKFKLYQDEQQSGLHQRSPKQYYEARNKGTKLQGSKEVPFYDRMHILTHLRKAKQRGYEANIALDEIQVRTKTDLGSPFSPTDTFGSPSVCSPSPSLRSPVFSSRSL